eukprot:5093648-Prymnesium_polylepis.1
MQEAVRLARMTVEELQPRAEEEAVAQWVLLMLARRCGGGARRRSVRLDWPVARVEGGGMRGR